jgi:lipoprotein-releasing system ATP-binding protein
MNAILDIRRLHKSFTSGEEQQVIFADFNFSVTAGQTVAITGESGSGKSTLLHLIAGLDTFQSGEIICCNQHVGILNEKQLSRYRNQSLGFIFQSHFLLQDFTALENVMMPAMIAGQNSSRMKQRATDLLHAVGLSGKAQSLPKTLSGGESQRVAICRALMNEPSLILADEPTGSLDERNAELVQQLLFSLGQQQNVALLLVTHDKQLAQLCSQQLALSKSRVMH